MSNGDLAPGKPQYWDVIGNKLYLNFSTSTRKKFLADPEKMIRDADTKWPGVEEKLSKTGTE